MRVTASLFPSNQETSLSLSILGQWEYEYKKSDRSGNRVKIPSDKSRNVYTITNPSSIETVEQGVSDVSLNEEVHVIEDPNQGSSYVGQMEEMPREISREDQSLSRRITARNSPHRSKYVDTSMGYTDLLRAQN